MAYAVLSGAGDNFGAGDQHNGMYYARPDGRVMALPHDMDFAFDAGRTIFANPEAAKLTQDPVRRRIYLGHLHDVASTVFNRNYMQRYTTQLAALLPGQNWNGHLSYINSRSNNILSQVNSRAQPAEFAITSGTGGAVTTPASPAVLAGDGWVDVREIRLAGAGAALPVRWTGINTWEANVPVAAGTSQVTLEAVDFNGQVVGSATVTVTNTGSLELPSADNLAVSEVYYNPPGGDEDTEFIELLNLSATATLDLTGAGFVQGVTFTFPTGTTLAPGQRVVVVREPSAFETRYGQGLPVAGQFSGELDNGGETLALVDAGGTGLRTFAYDDEAPWPTTPDGDDNSLVLADPDSNPDHALPESWRASANPGGSPGQAEPDAGPTFASWKAANGITDDTSDDDADGWDAFEEFVYGGDPQDPDAAAGPVAEFDGTSGASLLLTVQRRPGTDALRAISESSPDCSTWTRGSDATVAARLQAGPVEFVTYRIPFDPDQPGQFVRLRFEE
jgi:hypothetical protein